MNDIKSCNDIQKENTYKYPHELFDEMPMGISFCDSTGMVVDCNPAAVDMLGTNRENLIGYNIFDSYNFTDEQMDIIRTQDIYQYEVLYTVPQDIIRNSSAKVLSLDVKIVRHHNNEETTGYLVYLINNTHKWLEYEKQLEMHEKRYRNLIDNLPLDYTHSRLIFDENGQIADYLNMSGNKQCNDFYLAHNMTWGQTLATKFLPVTGHVIIDKLNEIRNSGAVGGHFFYDIVEINETNEMVAVFEGDEWVNLISMPVTTIEQARKLAVEQLEKEQEARFKDNSMLVTILSHIVEFRNGESGAHVLHIRWITKHILKRLIEKTTVYNLSEDDVEMIALAATLHDIGKIAVPEEILNKPGKFTDEEFAIMKQHPVSGAVIIESQNNYQNEPLLKYAYQIARWHHERWDGRGYPDGLSGEDIPIAAQIVSIADVYDALTSKRCYKPAFTHEQAIKMILNGECGIFNPLVIECLLDIQDLLKDGLIEE